MKSLDPMTKLVDNLYSWY